MRTWNKEDLEKFCEDNFLGEGLDEDLIRFMEGQQGHMVMEDDGQNNLILHIRILLKEY